MSTNTIRIRRFVAVRDEEIETKPEGGRVGVGRHDRLLGRRRGDLHGLRVPLVLLVQGEARRAPGQV